MTIQSSHLDTVLSDLKRLRDPVTARELHNLSSSPLSIDQVAKALHALTKNGKVEIVGEKTHQHTNKKVRQYMATEPDHTMVLDPPSSSPYQHKPMRIDHVPPLDQPVISDSDPTIRAIEREWQTLRRPIQQHKQLVDRLLAVYESMAEHKMDASADIIREAIAAIEECSA